MSRPSPVQVNEPQLPIPPLPASSNLCVQQLLRKRPTASNVQSEDSDDDIFPLPEHHKKAYVSSDSESVSCTPLKKKCFNSTDGKVKNSAHKKKPETVKTTFIKKPHTELKSPSTTDTDDFGRYPMSETKFQKKMFHLLFEIKDEIKALGSRCDLKIPPLQIERMDDIASLNNFDETLEEDHELQEQLKIQLQRIGGPTVECCATNIMKR